MALRYRADCVVSRRVLTLITTFASTPRNRERRPRWTGGRRCRGFERSSGGGPGSLRGLGLVRRLEGRVGLGGVVDHGLVLVMKRAARRQGGLTLDVEQVADALEGPDAAGLARLRAKLATDPRHPDTEVLEVVAVLRAPDLGQELGVEDDLAGVRG